MTQRFAMCRARAGITALDLGRLVGVGPKKISDIEKGLTANVTTETILLLSRVLGTTEEEMFDIFLEIQRELDARSKN